MGRKCLAVAVQGMVRLKDGILIGVHLFGPADA